MSAPDIHELTDHPLWSAGADGLAAVDSSGVILDANDAFERLFNFDGGAVGRSVEECVPPGARERHVELRAQYDERPATRSMGASRFLQGQRADGELFPITISLSPIETDDGVVTLVAVRDLTDRMAAESARAEAQRRQSIAEDHDRIARELHDRVIQHLFAVGLRLQGLPARIDDPMVVDVIDDSVDAIDSVITEIRSTIHGLRRDRDNDRSARMQILDVTGQMGSAAGDPASVRFVGDVDGGIDSAVLADLLAVLREALSNARRHADASNVEVTVTVDADIELRIADDGSGLPDGVSRSGLANMEARATALGGKLHLESAEPSGLVVRWVVPRQ